MNDGIHKSAIIEVPLGQFSGELVVGDEIIAVVEFDIDGSEDTIYLGKNRGVYSQASYNTEDRQIGILFPFIN